MGFLVSLKKIAFTAHSLQTHLKEPTYRFAMGFQREREERNEIECGQLATITDDMIRKRLFDLNRNRYCHS